MDELANKLKYDYENIDWLAKAMYAQKIKSELDGKHRKNYTNSSISTLGDAVLKLCLADKFYNSNLQKDEITVKKEMIESNENLNSISKTISLYFYAYNDDLFFKEAQLFALKRMRNKTNIDTLPSSSHELYLEAVIGAIFKDKGYDYTYNWISKFFIVD